MLYLFMSKTTVDELVEIYGAVLDRDTISGIHAEARGLKSECWSQLTMISGIDPPPAPADADGGEEGEEGSYGGEGESAMGSMQPTEEFGDGGYGDYYDAALPTEEERLELGRQKELNELMKRKVDDVAKIFAQDRTFDAKAERQRKLGPQSLRGGSLDSVINSIQKTSQVQIRKMIEREKEHCGDFVVMYHSYSFSALIYEVQACIARVIYGLPEDFAPSARLLTAPFQNRPHLKILMDDFKKMSARDEDTEYRELAICASVSLHSPSSEAPPITTFEGGYCQAVDFSGILRNIFLACGANGSDASTMLDACAKLSSKYDLHSAYYNGSGSRSGNYGGSHASGRCPGQMLQIFVRTDCVDDIAYGAFAYGEYDTNLNPLSEALTREKKAPDGQSRIFWHPALMFDNKKVKTYHYSADVKYGEKERLALQKDLIGALKPLLGTPASALKTYRALEEGIKKK